MTHADAFCLARSVADYLPADDRARLKAVHVVPRLHQGMLTIRCYFVNSTAPDPEPFIFDTTELQ